MRLRDAGLDTCALGCQLELWGPISVLSLTLSHAISITSSLTLAKKWRALECERSRLVAVCLPLHIMIVVSQQEVGCSSVMTSLWTIQTTNYNTELFVKLWHLIFVDRTNYNTELSVKLWHFIFVDRTNHNTELSVKLAGKAYEQAEGNKSNY